MSTSVVRLPIVQARVGLSRSQIYRLVSLGEFPPPVSLGPRAVAWVSDEIEAWIESRIELSRDSDSHRPVRGGSRD
jgi:prophage regulatory protein